MENTLKLEGLNEAVKQAIEANLPDALQEYFALQPQKPEYLSSKQVMEEYGVSFTTLWRYEKAGKLKPKRLGGKLLYRRQDIEGSLK